MKLRDLDRENGVRRNHASRYRNDLLDVPGVVTPPGPHGGEHAYHIYAIQVRDRPALLGHFERMQIGFGVHYPIPVHLQAAYRSLGHKPGEFPVAERCASRFVSLPMFPELAAAQIGYITEAVRETVGACATV
jgi:dTDP-4-amino-4,6-dideoxygalactose transaminase